MLIIKLTLLGEGLKMVDRHKQEAWVGEAEEEELTLQAYQCAEQHSAFQQSNPMYTN